VKHATPAALDAVEDLLVRLRAVEALTERKRGVFYRKSSAFLHFHEDPEGLFADVKLDGDFRRFRVSTAKERAALVRVVRDALRT
jgi:hypothetical protein